MDNKQLTINNSQLTIKKGYKNTEVGVIPEDWELKPIEKIGEIRGRVGWKGYTVKDLRESGAYTIGAKHIDKNNKLDLSDPTYLSKEKFLESPEIMVQKGDLLIVQRGSIGKLVLIEYEIGDATINPSMVILRLKKALSGYMYYYLISTSGQNQILNDTSSTGVPMITQKQVENFIVPVPSISEQSAIATALSDADALINSIEKLIAKKRMIKQGAMQQLLKPKEGWEVKKLGEIAEITGAGVDKKIIENEYSVRLLNYLDVYRRDYIYNKELNHTVSASYAKTKSCDVRKGDIFLTPSSELRTDIGVSAIAMEDMDGVVYSYHVYRLRYNIPINLLFGLYILKTKSFLDQSEKFCEGSGKRYVVSMGKFKNMALSLPLNIEEQTRIATILSDMDAEIQNLERKLEKYRKIKLGMMQELLTGKTRLV